MCTCRCLGADAEQLLIEEGDLRAVTGKSRISGGFAVLSLWSVYKLQLQVKIL